VFDIDAFVEYQPDILPHLQRLRQTLNMLVLTSRCLVTNTLKKKMNLMPTKKQTTVHSYLPNRIGLLLKAGGIERI
jgi:hypothetical protein